MHKALGAHRFNHQHYRKKEGRHGEDQRLRRKVEV